MLSLSSLFRNFEMRIPVAAGFLFTSMALLHEGAWEGPRKRGIWSLSGTKAE